MSLDLDRTTYFQAHRDAFGPLTQRQVEGLTVLLDGMAGDPPLTDERQGAYLLATAWHETAMTMQPIAELGTLRYFDRYDPVRANTAARRARARQMGNTQAGDGYRYRGRGYVQLTWKVNYARAGALLGLDLVADPDLALDPAIAYRILSEGMRDGWFTGRKLADDIHGPRADYVNARRIINGTDKAGLIAGYAHQFEVALRAALVKKNLAETRHP